MKASTGLDKSKGHQHAKKFHDITEDSQLKLQSLLLQWYDENKRSLPWRKPFEVTGAICSMIHFENFYSI